MFTVGQGRQAAVSEPAAPGTNRASATVPCADHPARGTGALWTGVLLSRWSCPELAAELTSRGITDTVSAFLGEIHGGIGQQRGWM
ncbi:hypothetical protein [Streptomyces atratus]|uniref:hypothetical protein n=1 Tax=Streptomyces atratus TaxID=1893 RepID=UPI002258056E|nr:hypothetical protein [Streptomyces atratus]MCX5345014.1 hypothetical protein [Streptomyces atratus]